MEKKLVAQFLVRAKVRRGEAIIRDNDCVVVPEGTSGLYVGLAIAAAREKVTVYTSNSGLIREYQDNPAIARRFSSLHVIGGRVNFDAESRRSKYDGVYGPSCVEQYRDALRCNPRASVVIMTVSRLTAKEGPFSSQPAAPIMAEILGESFVSGVREVVFIADYTKHFRLKERDIDVPMFHGSEWKHMIEQHGQGIHIVTSPPPALRAALAFRHGESVADRNLDRISGPRPFIAVDYEYDRAVKELCDLTASTSDGLKPTESMLHEAYEVIEDKELCVFTVDFPHPAFDDQHFLTQLAQLVDEDASDFSIRSERCESGTRAIVVGPMGFCETVMSHGEFGAASATGPDDAARGGAVDVMKSVLTGRGHGQSRQALATPDSCESQVLKAARVRARIARRGRVDWDVLDRGDGFAEFVKDKTIRSSSEEPSEPRRTSSVESATLSKSRTHGHTEASHNSTAAVRRVWIGSFGVCELLSTVADDKPKEIVPALARSR